MEIDHKQIEARNLGLAACSDSFEQLLGNSLWGLASEHGLTGSIGVGMHSQCPEVERSFSLLVLVARGGRGTILYVSSSTHENQPLASTNLPILVRSSD